MAAWVLTAFTLHAQEKPLLDTGFYLMYQLRFDDARREISTFEKQHPDDPLGPAAEAASYLFEEFNRQGVLTSSYFLDDDKLLGGIPGPSDQRHNAAFLENVRHAQLLAERLLKADSRDPDGLLGMTLADGMESDYEALIAKHQLASLRLIREAESVARRLLAVRPDVRDAYVALGAADYIIGCMPGYKRLLLWFGGYHGDRQLGMEELQLAADHGHYLQPLAQAFLALAAEREHQNNRAHALFSELNHRFPENSVFAHELAVLESR